ncbi:MAG: AIR synthase-related protein, partial [Pseudomonadales bacterium]
VRARAHITGGGILENLPRVMPKTAKARIDTGSWDMPEIFSWLQKQARIDDKEMMRTFNCGIGMVLVISDRDEEAVIDLLHAAGEQPFVIGEIVAREGDEEQVELF